MSTLSLSGQQNILKALEAAGLTYQLAVAIIEKPELAHEFVQAGAEKIKGKHRLTK
ncbi:MAG TPA: hypothetical protein VN665_02315 [Candidatus Paceibacterota bacterium]|nr:hypothetical protein [Candidatus Paceibacterota bacterium]